MKTAIGVYDTHEKAAEGLKELQKSGYAPAQLSIIAKAQLVEGHVHIKTKDDVQKAELSVGIVAGTILGVLAGIGIFVIPGGFLVGAGAFVGGLAGLDIGLIGGGLTAIFTKLGIDQFNAVKYEKHLDEGKFIIFAQGDDAQIKQAQKVLHTQGLAIELDLN